ncbi:hypothetical protein [Streptomyces sp. DSM 40484]|uniref:hypothetical protein n=1 Tax=Streptomyces kroppenstedtii TaxID=3051181 RepID=UPI0028D66DF6|nr:hypothetical protein [Streptomyces sp. DSM 40484]
MTGAAGLLLALVCLAIVATGVAAACVAWRPRPAGPAVTFAIVGGLAAGGLCLILAAVHTLADLLT